MENEMTTLPKQDRQVTVRLDAVTRAQLQKKLIDLDMDFNQWARIQIKKFIAEGSGTGS